MNRLQRTAYLFLISLVFPVFLLAAPAEMITIGASVVGPTLTLCPGGTTAAPTYGKAFISIQDQPVWATLHSATATPSASLGMLLGAGTNITVDHYNEFRAIRSGATDARAYVMCIP